MRAAVSGSIAAVSGSIAAAGAAARRRWNSAAAYAAALAAVVTMAAAPATAGGGKTFRQTTEKDFDEGEAQGVVILPPGELAPGLKATRLGGDAAFVWCATLAADGGTAFFGTGDEGRIYAVDVKTSAVRRVADLDAAWVSALAARPDGTLLAGGTPGGRVFAIDPKSGGAKELAKTGAEHVWALVHDPRTATTFAGTGPNGTLYAIDPKGAVRVHWDSEDKHVVSLATAPDGSLLAGTSEEAIVYRIRRDGHAQALHDFDAEEVRAIAVSGATIFLAVNEFDKTGTSAPAPPTPPAKGTKIVVASGGPPASAGALPRPGARKAKGAVYRLEPDGRIEQIHALADGYFTALAVDDDGSVLATSGTAGKVYRILPDRTVAVAADLPERQALAIVRAGADVLVAAGDAGGVFRLRRAEAKDATYLSKVLDAETPATWGLLRWHGARGIDFETRSGNTAKPDPAWSGWKPLAGVRDEAEGAAGSVASATARYLQYRAALRAKDARLRDVALHYLPLNQRARVTELAVNDVQAGSSGAPPGTPAPVPASSPARTHSPIAKLRWKIDNPDGDEIVYRLSYRPDGDTLWRPLGGPDPLPKPEYDWNTESVPDGLYVLRIVASDERANPQERALDFTYVSPAILVDNRKPEVAGLEVRGQAVAGRARDDASNITQIDYQIDGGDFLPVAPTDGILDDRVESFSFKLPRLPVGPHALVVRAADSADNLGAAQVTVRAK